MNAAISLLAKKADPDVVKKLEEALEQAKAGEIVGILLVTQKPEYIGYIIAGMRDRTAISGYLFHALHKLQYDE